MDFHPRKSEHHISLESRRQLSSKCMLEDGHDRKKRHPFTFQTYICIWKYWLWSMWRSTVDQPVMVEIICKKGQELGSNHWQRMVQPVQEATEGPCHIGKKKLDNEQLGNQHDLPLRTHCPIPASISTDKLKTASDTTPPYSSISTLPWSEYIWMSSWWPQYWLIPDDPQQKSSER